MNKTYTVKQVAEILGYSTNSIYTFLQEKRIRGVRVGKGRFRIPEEELNRVLHLSKKSEIISVRPNQPAVIEKTILVSQGSQQPVSDTPVFAMHGMHIVSIFDWFIGAAAIVLGSSLFLYSQLKGRLEFSDFLVWLKTFEISFIAGGIGIIITDLLHKKVPFSWHRFFHLTLILTYGAFSYVNFKINDPAGFLLYGLISLVAFIKLLVPVSGVRAFLYFIILYGLGLSLGFIFGIYNPVQANSAQMFLSSKAFFGSIGIIIMLLIGFFLIIGEKKPSVMFWISMVGLGIMMILNSVFFANKLAWNKSFFLLVTGLTCFLLPAWIYLKVAHDKERRTLVFAFGIMVTILIMGIGIIRIMQKNIIEYAAKELRSKHDFGKILIKDNMKSLRNTLKEASSNKLLIESVKQEDAERISNLVKLVYSSNENVEKIWLLKPDGSVLSSYPYGEKGQKNISRELYSPAVTQKKTHLFDKGLSAPLLDSDREVIGVLVVQLDLIKLKSDLQELANPKNDEYFVIFDRNDMPIINPNKAVQLSAGPLLYNTLEEKYNFAGQRVYQITGRLNELGWKIQTAASADKILAPTKTVSFAIYFTAVIFVGGVCLWLVYGKRHLGLI